MIIKQALFSAINPQGNPVAYKVDPGTRLEKTASTYSFLREVQAYVDRLRPDPAKLYVLVGALTASEYYSSNTNGDWFPEKALMHEGEAYGYRTFYKALPFQHHKNKDPDRAFGRVELAAWNPHMKRVELVVVIDRAKAVAEGAQSVLDKIDAGEFPDVSMGCKVPYDLCAICTDWSRITGNSKVDLATHAKRAIRGLSITRVDYCEHAKGMMNKILPDGRKVCVVNLQPRFFDISFVFIGAEKCSKTMACLANKGVVLPGHREVDGPVIMRLNELGDRELNRAFGHHDMSKVAAVMPGASLVYNIRGLQKKKAEGAERARYNQELYRTTTGIPKQSQHAKLSEILKEIHPQRFLSKAIPMLEKNERDVPNDLLNQMGRGDLGQSLSTSGMMGIVLKPREFQRIVLVRLNEKPLADRLDNAGKVFRLSDSFDDSVPFGARHFREPLARMLSQLVDSRSCFEPPLRRRIIRIRVEVCPERELTPCSSPLLAKVATAYNGYRRQMLESVATDAPTLMGEQPWLYGSVFGDDLLDDAFTGFQKVATNTTAAKALLTVIPILYLLAAHIGKTKERMAEGKEVGFLSKTIADNPTLSSMLAAGALRQAVTKAIA